MIVFMTNSSVTYSTMNLGKSKNAAITRGELTAAVYFVHRVHSVYSCGNLYFLPGSSDNIKFISLI